MALRITIVVDTPTPARLAAGVHAIVALNRLDMRALAAKGARLPALYESGVRYEREPHPREHWKTAVQVLADWRQGWGGADCEDLVAWRVAELLERGKTARPKVVSTGVRQWHVIVEHGDGRDEDPSLKLGMRV